MDKEEGRKDGAAQKVQRKRENSRERKTPEQLWEEAGYTNNFIFRMVMDDEIRCKQLLERLLGIKIDVVEIRQPEKSTEYDSKSKGILYV